jgi:hypothetical protein
MKSKILLFFSAIIILSVTSLYSDDFYNNKIVVKFKTSSGIEKLKPELDKIFKNYKINHFLSEPTLKFLNKKLVNDKNSFQSIKDYSLDRIYLIEFKENFDGVILADKISRNNMIEYAEPLYKRSIVDYPNDSLLSAQYALYKTHAFEAWQVLDSLGITDIVKVGVVDTGVDYTHEDLAGKIYINPGEDGLDVYGNDKRSNGFDDDNDEYIDNWHGWDFASDTDTTGTGTDNDPFPGHPHGTHVSGIVAGVANNVVGIAGINPLARIIPVKIGSDSHSTTNLINSYEGCFMHPWWVQV